MKRHIIICITALFALLFAFPEIVKATPKDMNEQWQKANTLYNNGNYHSAIEIYESIAAEGYISDKLFYNLGNAYFRSNNLGYAILNLSKAQRLNPSDKDIAYNLAHANSLVKDRIEEVPDFVLEKWIRDGRRSFNSNQWAVMSLLCLGITFSCVLLYVLSRRNGLRKLGFYAAIFFAVLFIITATFSIIEHKAFSDASHAVVTQSSAVVRSAPSSSGSELFILHEGTIVEMGSSAEEWVEITIADGNKGWIQNKAIDRISF